MEATILKDSVVYEHTDNVKPRFHEGDWVTNGIDCIFQIASIENGIYYDTNNCGSDIESTDKSYHLWTTNDAKDGDILAVTMYPEGTWIGIFKEQNGCTFSSHCFVNTEGTFKLGTHNHGNGRAIHPATKEQCDLLFKAMEDAGYTFDFDKKELKEIEHDVQLTEFEEAVKDLINDYRDAIGDNDATIDEVKEHAAYMLSLIHQNSAWSEEDCLQLDAAINIVANSGHTCTSDWLKSLKNRVIPQPKQEWSEEDEEHLNSIISDIKTNMGVYPRSQEVIDIYNDDISWLKSLKDRIQPQSKQEWSEEDERLCQCLIEDQEEALDKVSNDKYGHSEIISDLKEMYHERINWLKSLRPQNTWKPSDEQIKVCKEVYADILSAKGFDVGTINSELNRLYEQLTKLREE